MSEWQITRAALTPAAVLMLAPKPEPVPKQISVSMPALVSKQIPSPKPASALKPAPASKLIPAPKHCGPVRRGMVHSRFHRVVNLLVGGRILTVAENSLPDMPDTVYLPPEAVADLRMLVKEGDPVILRQGRIAAGNVEMRLPDDVRPMEPYRGPALSEEYLRALLDACESVKEPGGAALLPDGRRWWIAAALEAYTAALSRGSCDDAALPAIVGLGYGSTPSADDMILAVSGLFAGIREPFTEELLSRTTDISAKYLRTAGEEYYAAPLTDLLDDPDAERAAALAACGGFSGRDMLDGLKIACRLLLRDGG